MEMSHRDGAVRGAGGWHVRLGAIPAYRGLAHAGGSFAARRHHARAGRRVSSASRALAMDAVQRRRLRGHARAALVAAAGGQQGVITRPAETAAIPRHVLAHWTEQAGSARGQSRQQERTRAPQQKRRAFCPKRCGLPRAMRSVVLILNVGFRRSNATEGLRGKGARAWCRFRREARARERH